MNVTNGAMAPPMTKQWDGNVIQNPDMLTNRFTPGDKDKAASALRLVSDEKIDEVKGLLKKFDFSNISANELSEVGHILSDAGLIDDDVHAVLALGNPATDEDGVQVKRDVKYNAIAFFYESLEGTLSVSKGGTDPELMQQDSYRKTVESLQKTNQVINALSYFSNSARRDLAVRENV